MLKLDGFQDRVAVVTGGGSGIGARTGTMLAEQGALVVGLDIKIVPVAGVLDIHCDIGQPAEVEAAFERIRGTLGDPSILVGCAGIYQQMAFEDMPIEDWDYTLAAAAVLRSPALAWVGVSRGTEQAAQRGAADGDALALGEQVGQMAVIEIRVLVCRDGQDPGLDILLKAIARRSASIAVDETRGASGRKASAQPADAPLGSAQRGGGLDGPDLAGHEPREYPGPSLILARHRDRLLHPESMDKVADQLERSDSLSNNISLEGT